MKRSLNVFVKSEFLVKQERLEATLWLVSFLRAIAVLVFEIKNVYIYWLSLGALTGRFDFWVGMKLLL